MHLSLILLFALSCASAYAGQPIKQVSYAFVVDDTGSMSNEIKAVKSGIIDLLRIAPAAVANYVVVLFNDPTIGPWIKSINNTDIIRFVNRISHHGGGDCPELAMQGLQKAIELSDRGSFLFFFSDASAKDYHLHSNVTAEAKAKDIMILFVLTGCCTTNCTSKQFTAYKNITAEVDGRMYQVSKTGAEEFMKYTVLVAAKDAFMMKYAPPNFEVIVEVVKTGILPVPSKEPEKSTATTRPAGNPTMDNPTSLNRQRPNPTVDNGCSKTVFCSTVALIFVTGLFTIITTWSV